MNAKGELESLTASERAQFVEWWLGSLPEAPFQKISEEGRIRLFRQLKRSGIEKQFDRWLPLPGRPQIEIDRIVSQNFVNGWEIVGKPKSSYADFVEQTRWLQTVLGEPGAPFDAFGHQRVVIPRPREAGEIENGELYVAEILKVTQALIVARGFVGRTGLISSRPNIVMTDSDIKAPFSYRAVIRIENDKFAEDSWGLEFRSGVKNEENRIELQSILVSRLASLDFRGLVKSSDWTLLNLIRGGLETQRAVTREGIEALVVKMSSLYGVDPHDLRKYIDIVHETEARAKRRIRTEMALFPFWNWLEAPFIGESRLEIKRLTQDFLQRVLEIGELSFTDLEFELRRWTQASRLEERMLQYLKPSRVVETAKRYGPSKGVREVEMGLELTFRLPLRLVGNYLQDIQTRQLIWQDTIYDLNQEARQQFMNRLASRLSQSLGGIPSEVKFYSKNISGQSIGFGYSFLDSQGRQWKVEWDGISRSYDDRGELRPDSVRGGHLEIISPKFLPEGFDFERIYGVTREFGLVAESQFGGGHFSIDLSEFEKDPKRLARFLALFHEYRGIILFLFQDPRRLKNATPVDVDQNLQRRLVQFKGSNDDLRRLLYESHYFNDRVGRKTRYTSIDVSEYLAPILPPELLRGEFDVVRAMQQGVEGWLPSFRIQGLNKMELRFLDAHLTPEELRLALDVIRGLMQAAFDPRLEISTTARNVRYEAAIEDTESLRQQAMDLAETLGVNEKRILSRLSERILHIRRVLKVSPIEELKKAHNTRFPRSNKNLWPNLNHPKHTPLSCDKVYSLTL